MDRKSRVIVIDLAGESQDVHSLRPREESECSDCLDCDCGKKPEKGAEQTEPALQEITNTSLTDENRRLYKIISDMGHQIDAIHRRGINRRGNVY